MQQVLCQNVEVGDLLVLRDTMIVPADCLVLRVPSSSDHCEI